MGVLHVEKLGGLAGYGTTRARVRSRGSVDTAALSAADRTAIDSLFRAGGTAAPPHAADGFRFRLVRDTPAGPETVEVDEAHVPAALASCVRDELV